MAWNLYMYIPPPVWADLSWPLRIAVLGGSTHPTRPKHFPASPQRHCLNDRVYLFIYLKHAPPSGGTRKTSTSMCKNSHRPCMRRGAGPGSASSLSLQSSGHREGVILGMHLLFISLPPRLRRGLSFAHWGVKCGGEEGGAKAAL